MKNKKITPEEAEICTILMEECSEVVQAVTKVFRFGWDSDHPNIPNWSNKERLQEELGDLICMIGLLVTKGIVDDAAIKLAAERKLGKLKMYSGINL